MAIFGQMANCTAKDEAGGNMQVGANLHLIEWIILMQLFLLIKQRILCGDECGTSVPQNIRGQISNLSPKCLERKR